MRNENFEKARKSSREIIKIGVRLLVLALMLAVAMVIPGREIYGMLGEDKPLFVDLLYYGGWTAGAIIAATGSGALVMGLISRSALKQETNTR